MFLNKQAPSEINYYKKLLKIAGSLSNLFSDNDVPYLYYRYVENLFCKAFGAKNLSRSDLSADASKNNLGLGIKTFIHKNGNGFEKITELDTEMELLRDLGTEDMVKRISEIRNERIAITKRTFGLEDIIYHCVTRKPSKILIYEVPMDKVNIDKIQVKSRKGTVINFNDDKNEYKFYLSKSTLLKRFAPIESPIEFDVDILSDPFKELEKLLEDVTELAVPSTQEYDQVILPLYSYKDGKPYVYPKSGLNIWNAGGRPRDLGEVYIRIPSWTHEIFPNFFPSRNIKFTLIKPDGNIMSAKVCQDNSKALMSDPNNKLGEWLLRTVLNLKEGEVLTYEKLEELGIDSVVITKKAEDKFNIDFAKTGSYEEFKNSID
ncbi:MAG: NgoFVII family restriction endonuclease [Actinobacteria bacterium]|nr:NgoFVII family restriction endonuclease [Actinomycetota bacterium]